LETWRGVPDVKFLGDVRFRPDWIIRSCLMTKAHIPPAQR
jgi:hypothetical protein